MTACGRIGFEQGGDGGVARDEDGRPTGVDGVAACNYSPWGVPQTEALLSSPATDWGPHLSRDGLTLYFASNRNGGGDEMFHTERASSTSAWQAPSLVPLTATIGVADDPSTSVDELELFWGPGVQYATRATIAAPWTPRGSAMITAAGFSIEGGADLSADGLTILFTGRETADMRWHQYQATRVSIGAPWSAAAAIPLAHTAEGEAFGSYSGDLLDIVFSYETTQRAMEATRATVNDPFGAATPIVELDQAGWFAADPDLSDDRLTMWFATNRSGNAGDYDLWFSTRTCL